jgi:hypothetical protein
MYRSFNALMEQKNQIRNEELRADMWGGFNIPSPESEVIRSSKCPELFAFVVIGLLFGGMLERDDVVDTVFAHETPWFLRLAHAGVVPKAQELPRR